MTRTPTLGRELTLALVVVFAGALLLAAAGVILMLPLFATSSEAGIYLAVLVVADIAVFAAFGYYLVRRRVLDPLARVVREVEAIEEGDYSLRIGVGETQEVRRLADSVNRMAERLIAHQQELAYNVRSLEETNRQLTEARDELIRMEKVASVGRLAAGIAHEIGNPLGAILGYLGVLGRGADETRRELVRQAEAETRRIDRIVHGLLDYARPREARSRSVAVNEVVQQTLELLSTQGKFSRVVVETDLAPGLPSVVADANQLQQVLVNLLINALDAMDGVERPRVDLTTELVRVRPVTLWRKRRKDDPPDVDYSHRRRFHRAPRLPRDDIFPVAMEVVQIQVRDNGPGVPPEHLEHIFEPFYTTKEPGKGTGLGLAVSARLIDGMGGTIRVESRGGEGTSFAVLLPPEGSVPGPADGDRFARSREAAS
ncbi:MAG: sensor histidine kinase [Longimicrobiales bacterium]